jgi:hypothetical protein
MKLTKSQLREIIREEIKNLREKTVPSKGSPDWNQHKIAVDTVRNPNKSFLGGMDSEEAEKILKTKFKYSQREVDKLKR